jgi:hypothetical protein
VNKLTPRQVYNLLYTVTKHDNKHLGEDKSSRVANIYAVKATWTVYNNPREYLRFVSALLRIYNIN